MKFLNITFLMTLCLYLFINSYNYVNASFNISADRSDYIKAQLDIRSNAVTNELNTLANNINDVFSTQYGGLFFGLSTATNTLSGLFGMLNFGIPCGGAAVISSAVLGVAQNFLESAKAGDIGYTIAQGVNSLIKQQISNYNTQELAAKIKYIHEIQSGFYTDGTLLGYVTTLNNALNLNTQYEAERAYFEKSDYQLDSIGLYTIYANAHLLYLYDMVVSGPNYQFNQTDINRFYNKFTAAVSYYRSYINAVDEKGREALENVGVDGKSNQDEWNIRNEYYNYMKIFVYDISNYWDYLDPVKFPTGAFLENAHVSLSNLFGAPYNGDYHMVSSNIDSYLLGKNAYQYQGKLTGIYYKNYGCESAGVYEYNLVKYFGGKQFFFRDGVEKDSFFLGDTGSSYTLQYKSVKELESFTQYNARDQSPISYSRDYHWGLNASNTLIGNTDEFNSKELIKYPQKVVALALPLSYNECRVYCAGKEPTAYLVESAVMGFVNADVSNDNIVFELTASMVDAQKYNYIYPQTGYSYSRDGYQRYKHSMYIPANSLVTYKIQYTPYNKQPGTFKLYLDFKPVTSGTNVKVYNTKYDYECINQVINKDSTSTGIQEIGNMILNPSNLADNYVTVQFSKSVYFQHLVFKAIE